MNILCTIYTHCVLWFANLLWYIHCVSWCFANLWYNKCVSWCFANLLWYIHCVSWCFANLLWYNCVSWWIFLCVYIHKDAVIFQSATDTICMGDRLCISTYDERLNEELLKVLYEMFPSSGW